jgi:acyl-coenzyme A synthetase/AMP-(fatty) acid ligase
MIETLADHFTEQARTGDGTGSPALIWQGEAIAYEELNMMVDAIAADIERLEPEAGKPVGIRAKKSPEAIAMILACLKLRLPFVLPSVELASDTLDKLFAQADVSHVIAPRIQASGAGWISSSQPPRDEAVEWPPPGAEGVSFMLTTSGSTGLPKIVPLLADGIDKFTEWASEAFEIGSGTAVLNYAPLNFDLCLLDIWTTLKYGGSVVMVDQDRATNGAYLADLIADRGVSVVQGVPMLYRLLVDATKEDGRHFPTVRHVIATGDKIPATLLAELPGVFPNARFYNVYGCTETNDSLMHEFDMSAEIPANIPVGSPLPGVVARIETEDGQLLDEGEGTGELVVWTPFQTQGYLRSELNADKFKQYPGDDKNWFRSGDIVRRHADGTITLEGRSDFYVKVRGVRVSTQVVEQAIQEHPDVIEVAVVAVPDELAGARLHACVRKAEDAKLNSLSLRQHMVKRLARTEMPSSIEIVTEPLPKTSTGKIDRKRVGPRQEGTGNG